MGYVGSRARTAQEVRKRLARAGFGELVVERVIERLLELGYLNDAEYARRYAESRFGAKGYGPQRIRRELRHRGVAEQETEAALEELLQTADPLEAAREQAEKRWKRLEGETDPRKRRKKLSDFLVRRGFSFDTIRQVTDELRQRGA
jgi:regulatory protein